MRAQTLLSALLLSLAACGGGSAPAPGAATPTGGIPAAESSLPKQADHPESDKVTWKKDTPGKSCRTTTKTGGDLVASLNAMAAGCIDNKKMHLVGQPTNGSGQETGGQMVTSIPLKAQANHCYRIVGLAEAGVTDLDIAVMDSAGKSAGEDLNDSNDAIVLEESSICFKADDNVNVNVAVAKGSGKWAVEIWSD